jgi:8-oxo-dGTP diphosphatase
VSAKEKADATSASSTKLVRAAGGLVWRAGPDGVELVLVHRPSYDDWSFPKGKLNVGESELDAALREVEEEIGVVCEVGREIGSISYTDGRGRPKTVRYWEMRLADGDVLAPANEVDDARWVPVDAAVAMLTYDHDRLLLERFEGHA